MTPALFAFALTLIEAIWLATTWDVRPGLHLWLAGHAMLIAGAAVVLALRVPSGQDLAPYLMVLLATLVLGVPGALMGLLGGFAERRTRVDPSLLDAWYQRIALAGDVDRVTRLATAVAMGRSVKTDSAPPPDFERIIAEGTTAERQTALGLIARQFAPAYAPALKSALVSAEPVIRVQAAAVAVKVKGDLSAVLTILADTSAPCDGPRAAVAAAELQAMIATGLLDGEDEERARRAAAEFTDIAMMDFDLAAFATAGAAARGVVETELLRQRRFGEFRALRGAEAGSAVR